MKFQYECNELDVFEDTDDDVGMFNYCNTLAGHTLTIDARFELVPSDTGLPNVFIIKQRHLSTSHSEGTELPFKVPSAKASDKSCPQCKGKGVVLVWHESGKRIFYSCAICEVTGKIRL